MSETTLVPTPMFQMGITRALEVLERGPLVDGYLYNNPIDANWLGVGLGYSIAKEWVYHVSDGILELTAAGKVELARRRFLGGSRMPDGEVPTTYRPAIVRPRNKHAEYLARG